MAAEGLVPPLAGKEQFRDGAMAWNARPITCTGLLCGESIGDDTDLYPWQGVYNAGLDSRLNTFLNKRSGRCDLRRHDAHMTSLMFLSYAQNIHFRP